MFAIEVHAHYRFDTQSDAEDFLQALEQLEDEHEAQVSEPDCQP